MDKKIIPSTLLALALVSMLLPLVAYSPIAFAQEETEDISEAMIELSPTSRIANSLVTIAGTGFASNDIISVSFDDETIATDPPSVQTEMLMVRSQQQ